MIQENQRLVKIRTDEDEMTCIVCPVGCRMKIEHLEDGISVTGNRCKRGAEYAQEEYRDPRRVVTATCSISGAEVARLPVRSSQAVPVDAMARFLSEVYRLRLAAPVAEGDVVAQDVAGTGLDLVATMSLGGEDKENSG